MVAARRLATISLLVGPALAALHSVPAPFVADWEAEDLCAEVRLLQRGAELKPGVLSAAASLPSKGDARQTRRLLHEVCTAPANLSATLAETSAKVLNGLPRWPVADDTAPSSKEDVRLAFLVQVSYKDKLPLVSRTFSHIYHDRDVFLYMVDEKYLSVSSVRAVLPSPLPSNVFVEPASHAGYFYWPRVSLLLQGFEDLLAHDWDFVVHLSESDYPVHTMDWVRRSLAMQRRTNFINVKPRCANKATGATLSTWYWWSFRPAVATCGPEAEPQDVALVEFPLEAMEQKGFVWAQSPEWLILTREMVRYAVSPALQPYRQLVSAHKAADEIFWASLVLNIPGFNQTISPQGWFIQWTGEGHSPDLLTIAHEPRIMPGRRMFFFVRKVEEPASNLLLQRLDDLKAQEDEAPGPGNASWIQGDALRSWSPHAVACPLQAPGAEPASSSAYHAAHAQATHNPDVVVSMPASATFPSPAPAPPAVSSLMKWMPDGGDGPPAMHFDLP